MEWKTLILLRFTNIQWVENRKNKLQTTGPSGPDAARAGRDSRCKRFNRIKFAFQSTRPVRAATATGAVTTLTLGGFNPRNFPQKDGRLFVLGVGLQLPNHDAPPLPARTFAGANFFACSITASKCVSTAFGLASSIARNLAYTS